MKTKASMLLVVLVASGIAVLPFQSAAALEASWQPSSTYDSNTMDENGPLPLSKSYRDKLRKLCVLLDNPGSAGGIKDDKRSRELQKMCQRLKIDDSYSSSTTSIGISSPSRQAISVFGKSKLVKRIGAVVAVAITGFVSSVIYHGYSYYWSYFMELIKTVWQAL
jgi:hypothetical protein